MAAVFGLWFTPTYSDFVGLWACVFREWNRRSWSHKTGVELSQPGRPIPGEFFRSICTTEHHADFLCQETNNNRRDQCLMAQVNRPPGR